MATSPLSTSKFRNLFIACWLLWSAVHVLVLHWYHFPLSIAVIDSIISNFLLIGACVVVSTILRFYLPTSQRYGYVLMLCIVLAIIWFLISRTFLKMFTADVLDYKSFFTYSAPIKLAFGFLIIGSMALISVVWYILQDQQEAAKRQAEAERLSKEAELYKLRQQLQPHFLFNSLNSINALIGLQPQQARSMIQQLSDFLRGTLRKEEQAWVTLDEELEHLQLYLDIEKVRFGHRLSTVISNNTNQVPASLPVMLLQPVVENAIKFGLYDTTGAILISIDTKIENKELLIQVKNPFDPITSAPKKGTGFGLSSVQRRLYLLFARNDLVQTEIQDNFFITTIKIPQAS